MEQFKETRHTKIQTTKSMMICLFTTCDFDNSTILLLQVVKLHLFLRIAILFILIDPIQKNCFQSGWNISLSRKIIYCYKFWISLFNENKFFPFFGTQLYHPILYLHSWTHIWGQCIIWSYNNDGDDLEYFHLFEQE